MNRISMLSDFESNQYNDNNRSIAPDPNSIPPLLTLSIAPHLVQIPLLSKESSMPVDKIGPVPKINLDRLFTMPQSDSPAKAETPKDLDNQGMKYSISLLYIFPINLS